MKELEDNIFGHEGVRIVFRCRVSVTLEQDGRARSRARPPLSVTSAGRHLLSCRPRPEDSGNKARLLLAQFVSEEGTEFDTPCAEGPVAASNAALVQQFLHLSAVERTAVVQPDHAGG